jgi:hypothetical protein
MADLVAVGSGRSEVLNFFLGGTYSSSTAPLRTMDGDVVIRTVIQIALLVRPTLWKCSQFLRVSCRGRIRSDWASPRLATVTWG